MDVFRRLLHHHCPRPLAHPIVLGRLSLALPFAHSVVGGASLAAQGSAEARVRPKPALGCEGFLDYMDPESISLLVAVKLYLYMDDVSDICGITLLSRVNRLPRRLQLPIIHTTDPVSAALQGRATAAQGVDHTSSCGSASSSHVETERARKGM